MKKVYKLIPLAIFVLILGNLIHTYFGQMDSLDKLEEEKISKENQLVSVDNEIEDLEEQLENADSLDFVEKVAREKLKMVGPNDLVYVDKSEPED